MPSKSKTPKKPKKSKEKEVEGDQILVRRVDELMSTEALAAEAPEPDQEVDPLEDDDNDKAVDDIVAGESDTILAVNDAVVARAQESAEPGQPAGPRIRHKWAWFIFLIILVGSAADLYIFLSK